MRLLDDVCLIESEILVLPIVSTLDWSSTLCTWPSSYELSDSREALAYKSWNYDRSCHRWQKIRGKNSRLVASPRDLLRTRSLTVPIPKELPNVEYKHSRIADIILQVGWETSTSHAVCGQLSIIAVNIYCRLYWTHALITHYLRTGRKYALIKKYVLNKHVCLLTRLYGNSILQPRCLTNWINKVYSSSRAIKASLGHINYMYAACFDCSPSLLSIATLLL